MSKRTSNYNFYALQSGDIWWPGYDKTNMLTAENQLAALLNFVGSGVLSGWDVTLMSVDSGNALHATTISEQKALIQAYLNPLTQYSFLGKQFYNLGLVSTVTSALVAITTNVNLSAAPNVVDGITLHVGNRVLVMGQTSASNNGMYVVQTVGSGSNGVWVRSTDLSISSDFTPNMIFQVNSGTVYGLTVWALTPVNISTTSYILGTDNLNFYNPWTQVVRVTPGNGVIAPYAAATTNTYYFRFTSSNVYYVWAKNTLCLPTAGIATIVAPQTPQVDYDTHNMATYLATVEVSQTSVGSGIFYISDILYETRRNNLFDMAGALQQALQQVFYHHVHLGGPNHPSKINLSSSVILEAPIMQANGTPSNGAPLGSTIYLLYQIGSSTVFTWSESGYENVEANPKAIWYGIPSVLINDVVQDPSTYTLVPSAGKIYLKNSLKATDELNVVLPLTFQLMLTAQNPSAVISLISPTLFLTDGIEAYDADNNPIGPRFFNWNGDVYHNPIVSINNVIQSPNVYTFSPSGGTITFLSNILTSGDINASSVTVLIQRIGIEIQGKLSGKRISNVDASTFDKGVVDAKRIIGLDHVGQVIVQEPAPLIPTHRLLSAGDHLTFYPEILNANGTSSIMQYATETIYAGISENVSPSILVGTKRGLLNTADGTNYIQSTAWNTDQGEPAWFMDNLLRANGGGNHYHTTYLVTKQGYLYQTINGGQSWTLVKLPVDINGNLILATCIYASTEKTQEFNPIEHFVYSTYLYLGTEKGLYTATIQDQAGPDSWAWNLAPYATTDHIWAVQEIVTLTETCDDNGCLDSYARTLYVGADSGLYVDGYPVSTDVVKGFLWLTNGTAQNDLLWYTNTTVNISHTAQFIEIDGDTSTTTYWIHPLSNLSTATNHFTTPQMAPASVITLTNITLSGGAPNVVDGYALADNNRVVVAGQTNNTQNGVYFVQTLGSGSNGTWVRDNSGLLNDGYISSGAWITVLHGTQWNNSVWLIALNSTTSTIGASSILWTQQIIRAETINSDAFVYVYPQSGFTNYYMLSNNTVKLIQENPNPDWTTTSSLTTMTFLGPTIVSKSWNSVTQGMPRAITSTNSGYLIHSTRGVWLTTNGGTSWSRTNTPLSDNFLDSDDPTLYDEATFQTFTSTPWTKTAWRQSYDFSSALPVWQSLLYEKEYQSYFTAPWNPSGATVVVYVNGSATTTQYTLNPSTGNIVFKHSLGSQDIVTVTIVRLGAFITNVGRTPHQELSQTMLISATPATHLTKDMAVTDMTITVANPQSIPVNTTILQLRNALTSEFVYVTINPTTRAITLTTPRTGTTILNQISTNVYVVTIGPSLGIQDIISQSQTNETYHMNSLAGVNTIQLSIAMKNHFSNLFTDFYGTPNPTYVSSADLGPDNALFVDFSDSTAIDPIASSATLSIGVNPSSTDNPEQPHTIYCIYPTNVNTNGNGTYVGTDQGIWKYSSTTNRWTQDSNVNGAKVVYFIKQSGSLLYAGTSSGLYTKNTSSDINPWIYYSIYYENIYNYLNTSCFGRSLEAFSKSDGLTVVLTNNSVTPSTFVSDSFGPLEGYTVHSTHYDQFIRIDGNGNQSMVDCLYVCSDIGLYALISGSSSGQYHSFLTGLEAFGSNPNTEVITLANGGTQTVSIKYYQILKSNRPKSFIFHILTNNGIYRVRNWRWLDPAATADVIEYFTVEAQFLAGVSCTCSAQYVYTDGGNTTYKMFVGTDHGLYRTYNEGNSSWDRCERIGDINTPVYSVNAVNTGLGAYGVSLLVGTPSGLWATDDDGDTWYQPSLTDGMNVVFDGNVTSGYLVGANPYIAQTFTPTTEMGQYPKVVKVSLYLERDEVESGDPSLGNTITAQIYHADPVTGVPTLLTDAASGITIPLGGSSILASDVNYPGFWTVYTPSNLYTSAQHSDISYDATTQKFAIVVTENIALGGHSIIRWLRSELHNPYSDNSYTSPNAVTWTVISNVDFYFNVITLASPTPIVVAVNSGFAPTSTADTPGWFGGEFKGLVVDDNGYLTSDIKLACAITVDDSVSMTWADPNGTRLTEIPNIISTLFTPYLTTVTVDSVPSIYSPSFADFWLYGVVEEDRSSGFTNNLSQLELLGAALFGNGKVSALYDTSNINISNLQPQSIIDSIIIPGTDSVSVAETQANMSLLVAYLIERNILRLSDVQVWFNSQVTQSQWDGVTALDIPLYSDVSNFVAQQWAKSFLPIAVIVADGDDLNSGTASQVAITANNAWLNEGVQVFAYALGTSDNESNLREIISQSSGKLFNIDNESSGHDWNSATNSLTTGQINNVFVGTWTRDYDFEDGTFIDGVYAEYTIPYEGTALGAIPATCQIQFRYSTDRVNFTPWATLPDVSPYPDNTHRTNTTTISINQLVLNLQYKVTITDGWDGSEPVRPVISLLYHNQVFPGSQVILTPPNNTNGMLFEYLLSASANIPSTASVEWAIARGNTIDFTQFEPIINNRKACLPNREQGIEFTPLIIQPGLKTTTTDNITFQVLNSSNEPTNWASTDQVVVYVNGIAIDSARPNYSLDNVHGQIIFTGGGEPPSVVVTCDITTPQEMYTSRGEPTSTSDYYTYLAANGSWPSDSTVIVLVNNAIKRGGYWLSSQNGSVTFFTERETTDFVTLFVQPSNIFRVGAKVSNYSTDPVVLDNFGLFYTTQTNLPLQYEYANSPKPSLVGPPTISNAGNTIYSRLIVNYEFKSQDGNEESGTQITWWKKHGSGQFVQIIPANSLPDYTNRTVERLVDLGPSGLFVAGDQVYVSVKPSDGLTVGNSVNSNIITLVSTRTPWVDGIVITAQGSTVDTNGTLHVPAGNTITVTYAFHDLDSAPDGSTVTFYNKDSASPLQAPTVASPAVLAANITTPGMSVNCTILPYNGTINGTLVNSIDIIIS